eukprot:gene6342-4569_t
MVIGCIIPQPGHTSISINIYFLWTGGLTVPRNGTLCVGPIATL